MPLHGYKLKIKNKVTGAVHYTVDEDVHATSFNINQQWVDTLSVTARLELEITAEIDHNGNEVGNRWSLTANHKGCFRVYLFANFSKTIFIMHSGTLKTGIILLAMTVAATSCRKKPDPITSPALTTGEFGVEITNYAGDSLLVLDTKQYQTGTGDKFTVSKFNYYISNIKFTKTDGSYFSEPESYHLVYADANGGRHFHIEDVPVGGYTAITFLIGVDSARNTAGAQTGALDPAKAMFWDWTQGYIMAKLEGKSPNSGAADSTFRFHIGGFSGANSALRTVTLTFPFTVAMKGGGESTIPIKADVLKWFSPNTISMATTYSIMSVNSTSKKIADNYANMFSLLPFVVE